MKQSESGRILLRDDEQMVSEVTAEMLRFLGYEWTGACDGAEAMSSINR